MHLTRSSAVLRLRLFEHEVHSQNFRELFFRIGITPEIRLEIRKATEKMRTSGVS